MGRHPAGLLLRSCAVNCIVTAGPTYEPLDNVRRLSNFSTGRLGTELSCYLERQGHKVQLLIGRQATYSGPRPTAEVQIFDTTEDLRGRLQWLASEPVDALFHAAAVSDFAFGHIWLRSESGDLIPIRGGKIASGVGPLVAELVPTVKIIGHLREWYPKACLVGWKYEVDGGRASALAKAQKQILENRTNACVANGPAYGSGFGLVTADGHHTHLATQEDLFAALAQLI